MDWSNEHYVRLYIRDSADMLAIGWEGRAVWSQLLRKADRAGVLQYDGDRGILPDMLLMPREIIDVGLQKLCARGCVIDTTTRLVIRNFIEAQEAPKSDRQRQKESRERRSREAIGPNSLEPVTKRDEMSRDVTTRHGSHDCHDPVTLNCAVLSSAVLTSSATNVTDAPAPAPARVYGPAEKARKKPPAKSKSEITDAAEFFIGKFNRYFGRRARVATWLDDVAKAHRAGYTKHQMAGAAWGAWQRCADSPDVMANFKPSTILRLKSREGKTTLPQWLEIAEDEWRSTWKQKPMPWREDENGDRQSDEPPDAKSAELARGVQVALRAVPSNRS